MMCGVVARSGRAVKGPGREADPSNGAEEVARVQARAYSRHRAAEASRGDAHGRQRGDVSYVAWRMVAVQSVGGGHAAACMESQMCCTTPRQRKFDH